MRLRTAADIRMCLQCDAGETCSAVPRTSVAGRPSTGQNFVRLWLSLLPSWEETGTTYTYILRHVHL